MSNLLATVGLFWRRPPKVEKLARAGNVEGLVRALHYEDPITDRDGNPADLGTAVREEAAAALAAMHEPEAADGLLRALEDPEESVRTTTIRALREFGGSAGREPLLWVVTTWTEDDRAQLREEALQALRSFGDPEVPREVASRLLVRDVELDENDYRTLRELAESAGPEAVNATIDELAGHLREASAPWRAAALLAALEPASVDVLLGLLDDPRAREVAALALGSTHSASAVEPLCAVLLHSDSPEDRRAAAWALGEIKDPAAGEALLVATGDRDYEVRAAASAGFDNLGNAAIAVTMSALVRSALEDGRGAAPKPVPDAIVEPRPPAQSPAELSLSTRAAPVLRRLLGLDRPS
jgi:HEAT repeat protein